MPGDFGDSYDSGTGRYQYQGQVDPYAPSVANGAITPEQWAEYQKKRRRAAILGILGTVGGMAGAGLIGSALGGGGAAGGAAAGSMDAGLPAGMLPGGSMISTAFPASGVATGAAAGGAAGAAKGLLGGLTARDLASLGLTGASMIGSAMQDRPSLAPNTQTTDPNLTKLIQMMQGRLQKSEPLYDSILSMAHGLLPTQYQKGGGGMP